MLGPAGTTHRCSGGRHAGLRFARRATLILKRSGGVCTLVTMWKHVPNILTFMRLGLTVIFLGMVLHSPQVEAAKRPFFLDVAFVLFVIAGFSDIVDGHIARR
ncbi:MAG: CDP-alcohol phosphatidyltransferase family protein, partial [Solirubrobacterales bacterium]